jgi:hypothetical protein
MYFAGLFLSTATVYGNEQGCPMRKPVNCRDVLKQGKSAFIPRDKNVRLRRIALGMDARRPRRTPARLVTARPAATRERPNQSQGVDRSYAGKSVGLPGEARKTLSNTKSL